MMTSTLPPSIYDIQQAIIQEFQILDGDREATLQYLIELGEKLPTLPEEAKIEKNKIQGCMSTVWLSCQVLEDVLYFQADSNTTITKGLISLLIRVLSGQARSTILHTDLYFIDRIGMQQFIGAQRLSGLASMIQTIKELAIAPASAHAQAEDGVSLLREQILEAIKQVHDPEIPVNIYELGLIYEVNIYPLNNVHVLMTLTSPNCPAADIIPSDVKNKISMLEGVNEVEVEITFDPPYNTDRMSEAAKLELGFL